MQKEKYKRTELKLSREVLVVRQVEDQSKLYQLRTANPVKTETRRETVEFIGQQVSETSSEGVSVVEWSLL